MKISIIVESDVALMNSYVSDWIHWRKIMSILNYLLCALFVLSMACNKAVKEVGVSDTKEAKKDELVLKLVTDKKIEDTDSVLSTIDLDKTNKVELLTKSYLKDGKYQTLVKVKFEEEKTEDLKKKLEDQESIEKAYNNYIYEGNPFDMVQESSEDFTEDQPVEFEARHHKLLATKAALKNARGAGITVAVTDTGVAYDHTDLVDNIWMNEAENPLFPINLKSA